MDRRQWIAVALGLALLGAGLWGWRIWIDAEEQRELDAIAVRRRAAAAEREETRERLAEESRRWMPELLSGIALGQTLDEVRRARPSIAPARDARSELSIFREELGSHAQVVYGFTPREPHLVQVQVLSMLPSVEGIAPHLAAMRDRYGPPNAVWDCPVTGGAPTRRFTWRGAQVAMADVFLVYGERASITLYLATIDQMARSLVMASCTPVPADRIEVFPVATPEQLRGE